MDSEYTQPFMAFNLCLGYGKCVKFQQDVAVWQSPGFESKHKPHPFQSYILTIPLGSCPENTNAFLQYLNYIELKNANENKRSYNNNS